MRISDGSSDVCSSDLDRMSGFIVKSATEHASHGLDDGSIVGAAEVAGALEARVSGFGGRWFAEAFVDGREFNVAILDGPAGPQVLPPAEKIGRAHVCTPVTNAHLVCRLLLEKQ